jgi:hypothetical protein
MHVFEKWRELLHMGYDAWYLCKSFCQSQTVWRGIVSKSHGSTQFSLKSLPWITFMAMAHLWHPVLRLLLLYRGTLRCSELPKKTELPPQMMAGQVDDRLMGWRDWATSLRDLSEGDRRCCVQRASGGRIISLISAKVGQIHHSPKGRWVQPAPLGVWVCGHGRFFYGQMIFSFVPS